MTTEFSLLCDRCGLSQREAAEFLKTRIDTVKSWGSGRNRAPAAVIEELRDLYANIEDAAEIHSQLIEAMIDELGDPEDFEIGLASDDHEARQLGLPCVGAHKAVIGLAISGFPFVRFKIVPRGSTVATAAAADAHEKAMSRKKLDMR